jgi:hypothetical protein
MDLDQVPDLVPDPVPDMVPNPDPDIVLHPVPVPPDLFPDDTALQNDFNLSSDSE